MINAQPVVFGFFSVCIKIYQVAAPCFKALIVPKQNVCQTRFLIKQKHSLGSHYFAVISIHVLGLLGNHKVFAHQNVVYYFNLLDIWYLHFMRFFM